MTELAGYFLYTPIPRLLLWLGIGVIVVALIQVLAEIRLEVILTTIAITGVTLMTVLTLVTISSVVAAWAGVLMTIFCVFLAVLIADRVCRLILQAGMDWVQLYAGFQVAKTDAQARQLLVDVEREKARLAIREQRLQLLNELDDNAGIGR